MQSANPWLPHIHQAQDLGSALDSISNKTDASTTKSSIFTYRWMLDPYANQSLNEMLSSNSQRGTTAQIPNRQVSLLVGPEAGLSDQEVNAAKRAGFESIHLGPRTLRTETAALAAVAAMQQGQIDAARALGLPPGRIVRLVVIPQAMPVIIPPITSQYLNLIKNSSFGAAIAYPDIVAVFMGSALVATGQSIEIIAITLAIYLTLSLAVSLFMNWYNARHRLVTR